MEGKGVERGNNWNGRKGSGTANGIERTVRNGRKVESCEQDIRQSEGDNG